MTADGDWGCGWECVTSVADVAVWVLGVWGGGVCGGVTVGIAVGVRI